MATKYTHVIWDFNGTILDDLAACIDSVNILLENHGLPPIPDTEAYRRAFGFPVKDYYERIGFDFNKTPYDELAIEWVELYLEHTKEPVLSEGIAEILEYNRSIGLEQSVLSACEIDMLVSQLEQLGVMQFFTEVLGLSNIHADGKGGLARMWREVNPSAKVLYIGDTVHDFEVASILGADCALYAGGHHDRERLEACGVAVFDDFRELIKIIK